MDKFARIDFDRDECDIMAHLAEEAESIARDRGWTGAAQQALRARINGIRFKLSAASALFPTAIALPIRLDKPKH